MSESAFENLSGLWEALHGEPPSIVANPAMTVRVLVESLPPVGPYRLGRQEPEPGVKPPVA